MRAAHTHARMKLFFTLLPCPGFCPALPLLRVCAVPVRAAGGPGLERGRAPRRRHRAERGE